MRGRIAFLIRLLEKGWVVEGAKRRDRFWLGLYKHKGCFFISSFLAGKEAKEAGGTYDGSPSTPFQRSTGTPSPSIAPAQGDRVFVSHQAVVRTAPRGRRATAALELCWGSAKQSVCFRQSLVLG